MVSPSQEAIRKEIELLIPKIDINDVTMKQFVKILSEKMGEDLKEQKKFIRNTLTDILDQMEKEKESEAKSSSEADSELESDEGSEDEAEAEVQEKKKKRKTGLSCPKRLSPQLVEFLGKAEESRPQVVKSLWAYVKENNLQNPSDRREVLLDARLKEVFNVDSFTMFSMNKYVSAHLEPFKPVKLDELSDLSMKRKRQKKKVKNSKPPKKRKSGTQPAFRLSDDLARIVGKQILPRLQVFKALWAYIKENNLQVGAMTFLNLK